MNVKGDPSLKEQFREKSLIPSRQGNSFSKDWTWRFWLTVPLYPYSQRRTLRTEVIRNTLWTFDQLQGILYTVVPIRMTVVKLEMGGLFVYAPVAPTRECIQLVNELVAEHGDVKYILLPTSSGLEHKVFAGPFARCFSQAQVFVAPNQWSYPFNLPLSWLGFPRHRTQVLPLDSSQSPFADELDYAVLDIDLGRGSFAEVAVYHRRSRTLLVTDSVLSVPEDPPAIAQLDPYPLLFHARDSASEIIEDTAANRRKGWQRIALFALYFRPGALKTVGLGEAIRDVFKSPDRSKKAYFGIFPFRWETGWEQSFQALRSNGRPLVAPVLQTLIFVQAPQKVLDWVDRVATWDFQYIVSCHFDSLIQADPKQFRQAFSFLEAKADQNESMFLNERQIPPKDFEFMKELEANLIKLGIATPAKEK
jgi:hypothetical protein